ncbi:MAG: TatD family nuclease-associated radical SAM protein [Gammaproteobacteria bacterium]|nr:TatD family nuclease-associated radical SAM protein [Gammaproteobacteria bacterium]MDH5650665.1 TatD family nuclease-associated radical SAM protein [Gammaproteobacteria bacterium]
MSDDTLSYVIDTRLYLNITDRCTLVCAFCPKTHDEHTVKGHDLTLHQRPSLEQIIAAVGDPTRYDEVVFCGFGEPTLRLKVLLAVARYIKDNGGHVRLNTDGLANLFHKRNVLPEMQGLIDAVSVSMNAQNEAIYTRHCCPQLPGSYAAMLDFLRQAPAWIPEVTATAVNGLDGVDITACADLAAQLGVRFRARQLDVVG